MFDSSLGSLLRPQQNKFADFCMSHCVQEMFHYQEAEMHISGFKRGSQPEKECSLQVKMLSIIKTCYFIGTIFCVAYIHISYKEKE
jgi:hypothetical protein